MTVRARFKGWQVEVNYSKARPGYRRIRTQHNGTEQEARNLEQEILRTLETYGKWPVEEGDLPMDHNRKSGNLRLATDLALRTHWKGMASEKTVADSIWPVIKFFEDRKKYDIEDITSEDMDELVKWERSKGNSNGTINHHLSYLSTINSVAANRKPPMTTAKLPIKRLHHKRAEKWWLSPEDLERTITWLCTEVGDPMFADFIELVVRQGVRVTEALRLEPRHFTGLGGSEPWLKVPGSKTGESGNSVPVFGGSVEIVERSISRAKQNGWKKLFPLTLRQAQDRWNEVRDFLDVRHIPSATLRALRRTFAHYANQAGMPTRTLQKVLRHETITTTQQYLDLVGAKEVEGARAYFETVEKKNASKLNGSGGDLKSAIEAFRATGATPQEVAQFVKEMMTP